MKHCLTTDTYILLAKCRVISGVCLLVHKVTCGKYVKAYCESTSGYFHALLMQCPSSMATVVVVDWELNQKITVKYNDTRDPSTRAAQSKSWTHCLCGGLAPRNETDDCVCVGYETIILNFTTCGTLLAQAKEFSNMHLAFKMLAEEDQKIQNGQPGNRLAYFRDQLDEDGKPVPATELRFHDLKAKYDQVFLKTIAHQDMMDELNTDSDEDVAISGGVGDRAVRKVFKEVGKRAKMLKLTSRMPEDREDRYPIVVLNDFNPMARFFRAFYDIMISVLFCECATE